MGTYTVNYNLFMPSIGEQGWGELVNENISTIDTTMKGLDTRIATVEPLSVIQVDENQNVTFPALITANGGVEGNLTGKINISSCAASGDIKILNVTFSNPSLAHVAPSTANRTLSIPNSNSSNVTERMSSIFNYTGDKTSVNVTSTCTIAVTVRNNSSGSVSSSMTYTINVRDNTTNTIILNNKTMEFGGSFPSGYGESATATFTRNAAHNYTLTIRCSKSSSSFTYGVTLSTPTGYAYIPV